MAHCGFPLLVHPLPFCDSAFPSYLFDESKSAVVGKNTVVVENVQYVFQRSLCRHNHPSHHRELLDNNFYDVGGRLRCSVLVLQVQNVPC